MGAISHLGPLLAGRPARPIDIGREQIFITNPYSLATAELASREKLTSRERLASRGNRPPRRNRRRADPAGAAILARAARLALPGDHGADGLAADGADDPSGPRQAQHDPRDSTAIPGWVRGCVASPRSCGRPGFR